MKNWTLFIVTAVVVFLLGMLASNVINRKNEAKFAYTPKVTIGDNEPRNDVWGKNFPKQYQSYLQTLDTNFVSYQGGSGMVDLLEHDPLLVVLYAGYGFSKDYNQGRGHYYAIDDLNHSLRTGGPTGPNDGPMPATCWACKSPDIPRLMNEQGIDETYSGKWASKGHEVVNNIGCADCHNPKDMSLQITRPALIEAFESMGKDIGQATHNEMRSLVCAQCHVEYYFNTKTPVEGVPYLTFPWKNGMSVKNMEQYYDDIDFKDWEHSISKAPMLKAQHPGYEVYMTGIHADRGVSCADCHMPYKSEGGQKFTDHHIQSPLNNVANSCQVCHREETTKLIENVYTRQKAANENRLKLQEQIVRAHLEARKAWDLGATEEQMEHILQGLRHAQWRWDFAAASHGGSFHAPVETARILGSAMDVAQTTRLELARLLADLGYNQEVPMPDISTKAKAQEFIGLDMDKLIAEKEVFVENVIPQWLEEAKVRESKMEINSGVSPN